MMILHRCTAFLHALASMSIAAMMLLAGCATTSSTTTNTVEGGAGTGSTSTQPVGPTIDSAVVSGWITKGNEALDESRWSDAVAFFDSALRLDRRNPLALDGRARARTMLNDGSSLDRATREIRLRRETTLAEFDAAYVNAQDALLAHEFSAAKGMLLYAAVQLDDNRQILSRTEYSTRQTQANELLALIDEAGELARSHRRGF